jgi:hypothetical protein
VSPERLAEIMLELQKSAVTTSTWFHPATVIPQILAAVRIAPGGLHIPG